MFEIAGDDIAALNDADLRTLIGLLGEAEMRRRGLPTSAVTWGGNQTAKDGGLDVRVALPVAAPIAGFIPRPHTGFQVKKPDMPRTEILDEMKPKPTGILRPALVDLANASGAYIIVSSSGSTSDSALTNRRNAMVEAIKGTAAEGKLSLDFYDRNRVATWVRDHAGLIPWVRSRIGKAVPGWQSYGSWSHAGEGDDASYLSDDQARIRMGDKDGGDGVSAIEGINRIRKALGAAGHVVRLVGLSGVGKTRLAEALFDSSLGEGALDPSLAFYTNVADEPNPPPRVLASDLNAGQTRAIVLVDNCPPELHRQLSEVARAKGSTISVITIEYDIREDQPEGTDVFVLDTSSSEVIEKLVTQRYPDLSQVDSRTIAEFSGGNPRVALALASRIEKTETVTGLSEEELFRRLFQQRHDPDPSLLSIAQACSLVYSFEGEKLDGNEAELPALGSLIGKAADEVYAGVSELRRRDLVQARAQWRAVLPHAIANRLAKMALQNIPLAKVQSLLIDNVSERLLRSLSRRLGYLDDSKEAKAIVQAWLAPDGLLGNVANLNDLGQAMLSNIAPVAPEVVLSALENALSGTDETTLRSCTHFVRLLRSLAYEPSFFERVLALLVKFAALPSKDEGRSEAMGVVESLFHIMLSGTHAPIEMRVKAVEALLGSEDANMRLPGVKALEALMKTSHFSSDYKFDFGARSRDYGYHPRTSKDVQAWFDAVLKLASTFALSGRSVAGDVQKAIAHEFRGLWNNAGHAEDLDRLARDIGARSFWRDGWIATRQIRTFDGKALKPELRLRLTALEEFLRPKDLVSKVRGLVVAARGGSLELDDFNDEEDGEDKASGDTKQEDDYVGRAARSAMVIRELGHDVAADEDAFKMLLPELMGGDGRVAAFGEALAEAADKPRTMWDAIVAQFAVTKPLALHLLGGFLSGLEKRDAALADAILEESLESGPLAAWFPVLQASVTIDARALVRLHRALELGKASIDTFYSLAYGRACDKVLGPQFRDLVAAISRRPGGCSIGLDMIAMRLYSDGIAKREPLPEVREASRVLLGDFEFHRKDRRTISEDQRLGTIIRASLDGPEGVLVAQNFCRKFMTAAANRDISTYDYNDLMKALLKVHPVPVLDELFSGDAKSLKQSVRLLRDLSRFDKTVLDVLRDEVLLTWCDGDPGVRYPLAASVVTLFKRPNEGVPHEWTPLTRKLFEKAPDPSLLLNEVAQRLYPSTYGGSLATELEGRLKLLNSLPGGDAPALAAAMSAAKADLEATIDAERRREKEDHRARSNRFE
jgi:hypothetical protein